MRLPMSMGTSVKFESLTDLHKGTITAQAIVDYTAALLRFEHKDDPDLNVEICLPHETLVDLLREIYECRMEVSQGGEGGGN